MEKLKAKLTFKRVAIAVISLHVVALAIATIILLTFILIWMILFVITGPRRNLGNVIRSEVLEVTPIDMHKDEAVTIVDKLINETDEWILWDNRGLFINHERGFPYRRGNVSYQIGESSMAVSLNFSGQLTVVNWGFDAEGLLIEVFIKGGHPPIGGFRSELTVPIPE